MLSPVLDDLEANSHHYLAGMPEERRIAVVAEAGRMRERLSTIPWYADSARKCGAVYWLSLAISYRGE